MVSNPRDRQPRLNEEDATWLIVLVAPFLVSRLLWLTWAPEAASYWEELYRWAAMHQLLDAPVQPLLDYQADHYQGGSLLLILLGLPFVWISGESIIAFKLTALVFSTATLVVLYLLGRVFFGRAVGVVAGLAYLVGPSLVVFWGVTVMGFHAESTLFVLLQLFVFLGLVTGRWRNAAGWAAFGLCCGLGIWFCYTAGLGALACALTWLLLESRPRPREILAAGAGLAAGLAPWLVYNVSHDFAGFGRVLEVFGLRSGADPWPSQGILEKALDLLVHVLPVGLLDPSGAALPGGAALVLSLGFALPLLLALRAGLRRAVAALRGSGEPADALEVGRLELVFYVYTAVFVVAYLGSRLTVERSLGVIGYRLFTPLAVVWMTPAAVSLVRAWQGPARVRRVAAVAAAACFASLTVSSFAFASRPVENAQLSVERGYEVLGILIDRKHAPELEPSLAVVRRIRDPDLRQRAWVGIGWGIQHRFEQDGSLEELEARLREVPADERGHVLRGIRWFADYRVGALSERKSELGAAFEESRNLERVRALQRFVLAELERDAGAAAEGGRRPSVVIVTLDTTRVDHVSAYGYARETTPHLDALARRGVRFDRVWSTSAWTLPAHASLFTGLYPASHGARFDATGDAVLGDRVSLPVARYVRAGLLPEERTTLAELLSARGYRTGAFVAGPWLHRSFGLLQGFDTRDDEVSSFGGRSADEVTDRAIAWLGVQDGSAPYFLFVNYFDPHAPYRPPPGYDVFPRAGDPEPELTELLAGTRDLTPDEREVLVDRYDGEIRFMDHHLGRLLRAVDASPGGRDALIIVTADHGEAFGEGGRIGHTFWLSEELLRVPFVVRYPDGRGAGSVDATPLQLVDVLPLVAAELGIQTASDVEGVAPGRRRVAFAELYREPTASLRFGERFDRDLGAVIRWPHKLVRSSRGERSLSALGTALEERRLDHPELEGRLARLLEGHERSVERSAVTPAEVAPGTLEALRRLGYVD